MWPFETKQKPQPLLLKETSAEEDWDISLWLFDSDRTVEELEYFAQTGQRPTRFTKLVKTDLTKETFPVVSFHVKATEEEKPHVNFPPNPIRADTYLDSQSGTYYMWSGTKWRILANTPPQPKKNPRTKEGVKGVILNLKRPVFEDQLEEKQWCAREVSLLLGCDIKVSESCGCGIVFLNGEEILHPFENWDWHGKTTEEFIDHLYRLWFRQSQPRSSLNYLI